MSSPVVVRQIGVQRMPGINPPGFDVRELVGGINVIHGSNGSGKTTTANAIEMLLSAGDNLPQEAIVSGRFALGQHEYEVRVAAGRAACMHGTDPVAMPELGPRENRNRYRLALHDLVDPANNNRAFARAVLSTSHGGMDVP